ncbi:hypothetical protein J4403_04255 [Candidatus Woesearchaeota archaeon]|nr:hypothetical protein [Candidatus Woesearchaeota archaeon]
MKEKRVYYWIILACLAVIVTYFLYRLMVPALLVFLIYKVYQLERLIRSKDDTFSEKNN